MGTVESTKGGEHGSAEARKDSYTLQIESGADFLYIAALNLIWGRPSAVDIYANRCLQSHHAAYQTTSTQTTSTETTSTQTTVEVVMKGFGGLQSF